MSKISKISMISKISRGLGGSLNRPLAARAKDPGFNSPIAQHIQRLIYRVFTFGAVG